MPRKRTGGPRVAPPDEGVGYGRPPRRHRIRAEEVRNPWGRRGKPKPIVDFLDGTLELRIDGKPQRLTRAEALDHFLFAQAAKGNVRAVQLLQARSEARRQSAVVPGDTGMSPEQQAAFARFVRRARITQEGEP